MTSSINPNNINGVYPVAGVDNDSQGFRDNFTNIKNNLAFAASEISDLQSKAILKSALTNTTLNNNFAGALLSGAVVRDFRETSFDNSGQSGTVTLDHTTGHYQRIASSATVNIAFSNAPTAGLIGRYRLKFTAGSTSAKLVLPSSVLYGTQYISEFDPSTNSIGFVTSGAGVYYFEFLTDDAGVSFTVQDMTRAAIATDYTYANVANNFTISVTNKLIINSIAPELSVGNVNLPNDPINGQEVSISTTRKIDTLYLLANAGASTSISGNVTTMNGNTTVAYTYVTTENMWIKTN